MKKTINEIKLKIVDQYPIKEKFDFDEDLRVILDGEIVKKEIFQNNDGTVDVILRFKAMTFKVIKEAEEEKKLRKALK